MKSIFQKLKEADCIDISIPLSNQAVGPNCFYAPLFEINPYVVGKYICDTNKGGSINFFNVKINPHGNGTHTECVGHISKERVYINKVLKQSFFYAKLISVYPTVIENGDRIITAQQLESALESGTEAEALIIRTLPNHDDKLHRIYSGTNPPYFEDNAIKIIVDKGYKHLLVDLPSIDREEDGGKLLGHKMFWNYPETLDEEKTITELVFVPDVLKDGNYYINIQIPPFEMDAAPCRVLVYTNMD